MLNQDIVQTTRLTSYCRCAWVYFVYSSMHKLRGSLAYILWD